MGDAFWPPSPAPFVVVSEAATVPEHKWDLCAAQYQANEKSGLLLRASNCSCLRGLP